MVRTRQKLCICELNAFGRMINTRCFHYLELIKRCKNPQTKKALIKTRKKSFQEFLK